MQFSTFTSALLLSLIPLVSCANPQSCVAGGPADQIVIVHDCCLTWGGTWYEYHPNQAICSLPSTWQTNQYNACVDSVPYSLLDTKCIPGSAASIGLTGTATTTEVSQVTFTAVSRARRNM